MARMTVAEAKNHFSDVLRRAEYGNERIVVERHGKPVAAIVSTEDLRQLEAARMPWMSVMRERQKRRPAVKRTHASRNRRPR